MSTLTDSLMLLGSSSSPLERIARLAIEASDKLLKASGATADLNIELANTGNKAKSAAGGLIKFMKSSSAIDNARKGMKIVDDYINLQTRLNAVNDGLQTQAKLQNNVFAAANRSRSSYSSMVGTFANLQASADNVFGSNSETLAFSELMQKSFKLGGTDSATQSAGIDQVIKSMGSGKIDSGAFDIITTNAPMMLQAMETFTGKSKAELKSMADEGLITADILKESMFSASTNIDDQFSNMPMTFTDIWERIKNAGLQAFGGVIEVVNQIANSKSFQTFLNMVILGIQMIGDVLNWLISTVINSWDIISAILIGIGVALLPTIKTGIIELIAQLWSTVAPILAQAAAWAATILPILGIIAAVAGVVYLFNYLGVTVQDVFSFIGGVIGVFVAVFFNYFAVLGNYLAAFVNFFGNVFTHPVASIKALFLDLALNVIGYIASMAQGIEDLINKIPGVEVNITGGLDGLQKKLKKASDTVKNEAGLKEYIQSTEFMNYSDAATTGSGMANNLYNGLSDKISSLTKGFGMDSSGGLLKGYSTGLSGDSSNNDLGTASNPLTVQGVGADGTLGVDMAEEDIQYLRDIAERDYINKFSTATVAPNIQVSFGDIHQEADVDKVAGRIQKILREQIAVAGEGAY